MTRNIGFAASIFLILGLGAHEASACAKTEDLYGLQLRSLEGKAVSMADFRGQVLLVVNVASECGFTHQYEGLEALYQKYKAQGLRVLGFPCNQFGGQEPGDAKAIRYFCQSKYKVTFDMFEKTDVNGSNTHPLFKCLKAKAPGLLGSQNIKWNFTKFLVSRDGNRVLRFGSNTEPSELAATIETLLKDRQDIK